MESMQFDDKAKAITKIVVGTLGKEECFFFCSIFSTLFAHTPTKTARN